ncbi:restriction system modified-DNA reader domain-containing protein [Streptomyces rubiginosohelvolus]|uniref:restriction system modified-DNA reader domain-containing protein n=1 Tax=Streptomyces rubiginosohelvolus TaxID=67362 RepID=UPI0033F3D82E
MATLSIHFDPAVIARLVSASGDDTVHVTLSLGEGAASTQAAPVIPQGPLAGLMRAGLLEPGTVLTFRQRRANRLGRAVVTAEGQLVVDGHSSPFPSPSKAAEAVTGNVINGWTLWRTPEGSTLDQLRQELDAE